jgi:molybdenum cofactor cytidylyltransferase
VSATVRDRMADSSTAAAPSRAHAPLVAVLLAAGRGERYARAAGAGANKLLAHLPDGMPVAAAALRRLRDALGDVVPVIAVVRAGDAALAALLRAGGAQVLASESAARGMGASLADGARAVADGSALLVALADMPAIAAPTYHAVRDALAAGASIVQPRLGALPGHPVGFAARWLPALRTLDGDSGARGLLRAHAGEIHALALDDPGCVRDIDLPRDLPR